MAPLTRAIWPQDQSGAPNLTSLAPQLLPSSWASITALTLFSVKRSKIAATRVVSWRLPRMRAGEGFAKTRGVRSAGAGTRLPRRAAAGLAAAKAAARGAAKGRNIGVEGCWQPSLEERLCARRGSFL